MSTIVFLHAHPDDEASQTAGAMARAAADGHRVVVVFATGGEHGELPAGGLPEGKALVDWRRREAQASADVLGVRRVAWLGYVDSGMTGWEQNSAAGAFHGADLDEAATRLAAVLDEERADVLVGYDWHGGYGHPDHVRAHQVAHRAAELATTRPRVLESTMNRDLLRRLLAAPVPGSGPGDRGEEGGPAAGGGESWDPDAPQDDGNPLGTPEAEIHWQVDVTEYLPQRRAALEAHRSQATDIEAFLAMPDPVFGAAFGMEHYREPGREPGMRRGWPFGPATVGEPSGPATQDRYAAYDVTVDGGLLRVGAWKPVGAQDGSRLPVLAVHGVTSSHLAWPRVADHLDDRLVVAPDLRGRGHSNSLPGPYGMAAHADDLARVLDDHGVDRAVVLGHSMGGFVAMVLADRHPDRVAALVLVDGGLPLAVPDGLAPEQVAQAVLGPALDRLAMTFPDHAAYQQFWRAHPAFARDWDDVAQAYVDYDLQGEQPQLRPRTSSDALAGDNVDMLAGEAVTGAVERLRHPAWFLRAPRGLLDQVPPLYPDEVAADWQDRLPGLRMSTVHDVNHYTIVLADRGAAAVAATVEEAATAAE